MRKLRDLLYVNSDIDLNRITCYGVEFNHFMNSLKEPPQNILLLQHSFHEGKYNSKTRFEYADSDNMAKLINDDVYRYGTFCWVDFVNIEALNEITPSELAELLYFSHMGQPLKSYRISALDNRFAYWSHDDGWYNQIYCRNYEDFSSVLDKSIILRIKAKKGTINSVGEEISLSLLKLSKEGLLIDINELSKEGRGFELPIYIIGKLDDMDEMYRNVSQHKCKATKRFMLEYKTDKWELKDA